MHFLCDYFSSKIAKWPEGTSNPSCNTNPPAKALSSCRNKMLTWSWRSLFLTVLKKILSQSCPLTFICQLWHMCAHTHNKYDFKYFSESGACGTCDFLAVILCQRNVPCENLCYRFGTSNRHLTSGKGRVPVFFPDVFIKTMTKGSLQGRDGVNNFTSQLTAHQQGKPR